MQMAISSSYLGQDVEENPRSGVQVVVKGDKMIIVASTDHETGEDCEMGSRVTKLLIDSFLHRPSIEDRAIRGLSDYTNNSIQILQNQQKDPELCDVGAVFILRGAARWFIAGNSRVYHFENGKFARASDPQQTQPIGRKQQYVPRLEDPFSLTCDENAFLVCSKELTELITVEELESTLQKSGSPEEWMKNIVEIAGEARQYCAVAAFLPKPKKRLLDKEVLKCLITKS